MEEKRNKGPRRGAFFLSVLLVVAGLFGLILVSEEVSAAGPMVTITHPTEGMTVYGDTTDLNLTFEDFSLNPVFGGSNVAGEGHWVLRVNDAQYGMYAIKNVSLSPLPEGNHIFEVELLNNDNTSLTPKVNATVNITVAYPSIEILEPYEGAILYGGMMNLKAGVENFTLTSDFGGTNVNGEGHWHVYINDVLQNPYSGPWANFTRLPAGDHEIKADLRNNDHSAISPPSEDMINITVVFEMPEIMVTNLPMRAIGYGGVLNMHVGVNNFSLVQKFGQANVAKEGHYHLYINDVMQGMYTGEWLNLTGLPAGDHDFRLELVNNDHSSLMPEVNYEFDVTIVGNEPKIMLTHPMDGHIQYDGDLAVHVMIENFTMNSSAIGMDPVPGEGHYHIYINDALVGPYTDMMTVLTDLPVGDHVIKVELRNNDHTPLMPPVMDMASFSIVDADPMIDIFSPDNGTILYQDHLDLEVMISDLTMNASAIGGMNVAGEGHYHIYINDVLVGPYTDMMVTLSDLPAGDHVLKVMLVNNDHSPVIPEAMDMIHFTIVDADPSINLIEPMNNSIHYQDSIHVHVNIEQFMMNASAIGGMNKAGEGHYHIYINDGLVGPYTESMVTLSDLPAGDHVLKVVLVNNDHSHIMPMAMDMVHFTIVEEVPEIMIDMPVNGTIVYGDMLHVDVMVNNFTLNETAIGGMNMPGEGHWHLYINDDLIGPYATHMATLTDLPAGDHVLKVELRNNDHSMLTGPMDHFMDMVHFTISDMRPEIHIVHPMHGAIIYDDMIHLQVDVMNFTLNGTMIGSDMNMEGEGHYHIYINDNLVGPYNETMVNLTDLPAGDHVLKVVLVNNDHSHIQPMVMDMINFTISDDRPSISIVKPTDGAFFYGGDLEVEVSISGLMMNQSAIGGNNTAGEGHWHLYINDGLIGPYTDNTVMLSDLPVGHHVLKVQLMNNDHTPVMPEAHDMVEFHLLAVPMIMIESPANGTTIEGTSLDLEVEVTNFMLNSSAVGGTNAPGEGHYHIYINGDLVGPYTDLMVTLTDLPAGDHELKVELKNNDHSALGVEAMDMIQFTIVEPVTEITVTFGPVLSDGEPLEGAEVEIMSGGNSYKATTGADGIATFTLPASWEGADIDFKVTKDGYDDLEGTGSVGDDGSISVTGDLEVDEESDDDGTDPTIWIIVIVLIVVVLIGLFIILRPKDKKEDGLYEE